MVTPDPHQYIKDADLLFNAAQVTKAISIIAKSLNEHYASHYPIVLSVMNGAAVFTGRLLPLLTFPMELSYVHASRYHNGIEGSDVYWSVAPSKGIKNRHVIILDDILDEGITLRAIVNACTELGASDVKVAVLTEKTLQTPKPIQADFVGLNVPDRYVFGCGMDVYGWWRNLPAIYALNT